MSDATTVKSQETLTVEVKALRVCVSIRPDAPAELVSLAIAGVEAIRPHRIVEILTAAERHERMTLGYTGTAIGARLRVRDAVVDGATIEIEQHDVESGLIVRSRVVVVPSGDGIRLTHSVRNDAPHPVTVFALPTLSVRTAASPEVAHIVHGRSEWLGEGRWSEQALIDLLPDLDFAAVKQPDRTGFGQSSSGGWSTGSVLPTGVLAVGEGVSVGWQIESSAGWQWSLSRGDGGVVISAGGPTEREHQGDVRLAPGEAFQTVGAGVVVSTAGRDGVFAALTRYRRWLRPARLADRALPIVYNDYMNTLMGQPSTEALVPLIAAAAEAGAEYFCIDAGWFTDSTDYWSEIGEWREAPTRFTGGLRGVLDKIRAAGMRPGIWIEPESVGSDSPMVDSLPMDAFFQRRGSVVVQQRRRHLDMRHRAARAHLDDVVDRLVGEYGIEYLKLDYNIEPGSGTDVDGLAPGHGLLEHTRALREWLVAVQERHPTLLIENCASGAMRSDYHLLAVTHVQSTSDQQDAGRYAAIAAAAPASVLPEQAGNWAYPSSSMSKGELALTLVSGLSGRLALSGFLDALAPDARALVREAIALARTGRDRLAEAVPFWPLGLPGWHDDLLVLGLRDSAGETLYVWSRGAGGELGVAETAIQIFPAEGAWPREGGRVRVPPGPDAAVFRIPSAETS